MTQRWKNNWQGKIAQQQHVEVLSCGDIYAQNEGGRLSTCWL